MYLLVRIPVPVEDKVLEEEDEIEAETDGGEAELGEVLGKRGPVLTVVRHQNHPEQTGQAATEVQKDVAHTRPDGQESVDTEDHVIELDWENAVRVEKEVVGLHAGFEEHLDVEDAVQTEPEHIQDHEVHVQPLRTGPPEV